MLILKLKIMKNDSLNLIPKRILFSTVMASALLAVSPQIAWAEANEMQTVMQSGSIKGQVVDATGEPVIGASVMVKGSTNGTITDVEGNFTLSGVPGSGVLVISYIGYKTEELSVKGKTSLKITLSEDSKALDEVVVVGYGVQKKASLTSAISQVGAEVFKDRGVNNAGIALQGAVPGVVVTRSSTRPGSEGLSMKVRGNISVNDLNGSGVDTSAPLVIIDGVTGSLNELSQMDPNNIESMSVLKDASAAIYGSRSAYGVVLVTTKRGKGKPKINYNGSVSTTVDGLRVPLTNAYEWLTMFKEAQTNDALAVGNVDDKGNPIINWWIFQNYGGEELYNKILSAAQTGVGFTNEQDGKTVYYQPTDLQDYMYGQATSNKHTLSISGSDEKFTYYAALGYSNAQSQLKVAEDGEKKWNGRINASYQPSKLFKVETGVSYDKQKVITPRSGVGGGWNDMYFWPIYNEKGQFYDTFGYRNPVAFIKDGGNVKNQLETFRANLAVDFDLSEYVKGLSFRATGAYKKVERNKATIKQEVTTYDWAGVQTAKKDGPGEHKEELEWWTNQNYGIYANYVNTFADVHNVSAMVGVNAEQEDYKKVTAWRNGGFLYPGSGLEDLDVTIGGTGYEGSGGGANSWGLVSYMARLNYDYDSKYLVEVLGRRDGSSKLFPDYRWKNFYSVSAGWRISEEKFMKSLTFLNNLKIRYNYGKTGSINGIGNYEAYATMKTGSYIFGDANVAQTSVWLNSMTSPLRTWETINSHDVGVDFAFFNNRLSGNFDWFQKTNDGMFIQVAYPSILGASAPKTNDGKFRTHGWELQMDWRDQVGKVNYNIGFQLGDYKSKILNLNTVAVPAAGINRTLEGYPLNSIFAFKTDGIFQNQQEVDDYYAKYYYEADGTTMKSGNIIPQNNPKSTNRLRPGARKLVDVDGDGVITKDDIVYMGDNNPHFSFGVRMGLEWKGIDFNAFFQGVGSQKVMRGGNLYGPFVSNYTNQVNIYMGKTWTEEYPDAEYTMLSRDQDFNKWNYQNRDVSVMNGRYVRLKSLVVGYTLPQVWTSKAGLSKVRIYFSGEDLWEWTSIKDGYDPEFGEASNNTFPFSRLLSFGLDLTF